MKRAQRLFIGLVVGLVIGCVASVGGRVNDPGPEYTTIVVHNDNWALMRLYMAPNQADAVRFGEVETGETRVFTVRTRPEVEYTFVVSPLAGEKVSIGTLSIRPGATVAINIENQLSLSAIFLR